MNSLPLAGRRVAVFLESKYIPEEIAAYQQVFPELGAEVKLVSRIWYGDYKPTITEIVDGKPVEKPNPNWNHPTFYSDVDPSDGNPMQLPQTLTIDDNADVSQLRYEDFDAIIMAANYTSVRLRYAEAPTGLDPRAFVQSAPVPRFFHEAMPRKNLIKGALCHGLWILSPFPEDLSGRKVTCHTVVMADVLNCGAEIVFEAEDSGKRSPAKVVRDGDLVTGFDKHQVVPFIHKIAEAIQELPPRC